MYVVFMDDVCRVYGSCKCQRSCSWVMFVYVLTCMQLNHVSVYVYVAAHK